MNRSGKLGAVRLGGSITGREFTKKGQAKALNVKLTIDFNSLGSVKHFESLLLG